MDGTMRKQGAQQAWDHEQIARAVGYTTSRFMGVGLYDTRPFDTLPAALADAYGDRRAMVYAITPEGWTVHITNGDKITTDTPAIGTKATAAKAACRDRQCRVSCSPVREASAFFRSAKMPATSILTNGGRWPANRTSYRGFSARLGWWR